MARIEYLGKGKFIVESFSEPEKFYEVNPWTLKCTCDAIMKWKKTWCHHLKKVSEANFVVEPKYDPDHYKMVKEPEGYTFLTAWRSEDLWRPY